jgi:5'-nucleotidase
MDMKKKPTILVTNDDGMFAPGIKKLISIAKKFGVVIVVAPDSPQSGQGHAVTLSQPIRLHKVNVFEDVEAYECSGTPVDCVKLAKNVLFKDRNIDLCVSGINHGSNASINILYSGTMSAAMEAALENIDSIGFSHMNYSFDADMNAAESYIEMIIAYVLEKGLSDSRLLNVNIPNLPADEIKGIRICRQSPGRWEEEFQIGTDPRGERYYWLTGKFVAEDEGTDSDLWALRNGYISIVPSKYDLTDHNAIGHLKGLEMKNI